MGDEVQTRDGKLRLTENVYKLPHMLISGGKTYFILTLKIRLKNERAYYAVTDLLVYGNPERTAFKIINRYIRFVDKDDSKPSSDWKLNKEWSYYVNDGVIKTIGKDYVSKN